MNTQHQNPQMSSPDPQQPNSIQQPPIADQQPLNLNQQSPQPPIPNPQPLVYPGSRSYSSYPYYPWAILCQVWNHAINAEHRWAQSEIENARYRDRTAQREQKEDAYTDIKNSSGHTFTTDRLGQMVELMNTEIESAIHAFFDEPFKWGDAYLIKIEGFNQPVLLDSRKFSRDSELIQFFQELPGVEIRPCRTTKLTASLLRKAIAKRTQVIRVPFYGGWMLDHRRSFSFWLFDNGATHLTWGLVPAGFSASKAMPEATTLAAVQHFKQTFQIDQTKPENWLLGLMFHTAALFSLLQQLGHPFPLAFCILTERASIQAWLKAWFSWFGDFPLSLELPPVKFVKGLLASKDQPIVILDEHGGAYSTQNSATLECVLTTHQISWKDGRQDKSTPLQALPVVLSSIVSTLTVHPDCLTVVFPAESTFPLPGAANESAKSDYLAAFVGYTTGHIDDLRRLLDDGQQQSFDLGTDNLTENCVSALGILLALDNFVRGFHRHCGLTVPSLEEECPDALDWLLELLEQTSDKLLDCGDLVTLFVSISRKMLSDGTLCPSPAEHNGETNGSVVYYDDDRLGFTISAMNAICRSLGQSRPLVLHALSEAGLLLGKPVNGGTFLTRISTWNVYGQRKTERVYLFARELFDELGDPLVLGGEEP